MCLALNNFMFHMHDNMWVIRQYFLGGGSSLGSCDNALCQTVMMVDVFMYAMVVILFVLCMYVVCMLILFLMSCSDVML